MKKKIIYASVSVLAAGVILFLALTLKHAADNVVFLNAVREQQSYLYPVCVDDVQVSWGGLRVEIPQAFNDYWEKWVPQTQLLFWHRHVSEDAPSARDIYLRVLRDLGYEIGYERTRIALLTNAIPVYVHFSAGDQLEICGTDHYSVLLPVNKTNELRMVLYEAIRCTELIKECESQAKKMGGQIGWASHKLDAGIDALPTEQVVRTLENFSSILSWLEGKCGKNVVWIYNDGWQMPEEYGVTSITLSLPPTNGKWQAVTRDMIVPPRSKIVVDLAVKDFDSLAVGIERQLKQLKGGGKK